MYFIHNFKFWCKINKFISFFSKNKWKSCVNRDNKLVDIPLSYIVNGILLFIKLVFHILINSFFNYYLYLCRQNEKITYYRNAKAVC